jgi:hypothetical protein
MQDTTASSSNSKGKPLTQWLLQGLTIAKTSLLLVLRNVGASPYQGIGLPTQRRYKRAFTIIVAYTFLAIREIANTASTDCRLKANLAVECSR